MVGKPTPRLIRDPGPAPRPIPSPIPQTVGSPASTNEAWGPDPTVIRDPLPSPISVEVIKAGQGKGRGSRKCRGICRLILPLVSPQTLIQVSQTGGSFPSCQNLRGTLLMPAIPIIELWGISELKRNWRAPAKHQVAPFGNGNGAQLLAVGLGASLSDDHLDPLILPDRHPVIALLEESDRRRWRADLDPPGKSTIRLSRRNGVLWQGLHEISRSGHQREGEGPHRECKAKFSRSPLVDLELALGCQSEEVAPSPVDLQASLIPRQELIALLNGQVDGGIVPVLGGIPTPLVAHFAREKRDASDWELLFWSKVGLGGHDGADQARMAR